MVSIHVYVRDVDCRRFQWSVDATLSSKRNYIYTLQTNPSQAYRNLESYIIVFFESRRAYQCVICLRRPRMDFFKRYTYNKCFSAYLIYIM